MRLTEFLARLEAVTEERDGWLAACPAHPDSNPSLRVTVSAAGKVLVHDRAGCETPTVLAALNLDMRTLDTMEADTTPASPAAAADVAPATSDVAALAVQLDDYADALMGPGGAGAREYAAARFGATEEDMRRLGLGFAAHLHGGPRLVVPFRGQDGAPGGFQARALDADAAVRWSGPRNPDGANWSKVGFFPGSSGWDEVLVCEGPGDAVTGAVVGYDTVGIRGAALAANAAVVETVAGIVGDREAVVCGDGDPAGRRFSATLAEALTTAGVRVRVVDMPEGEDLTSWRESSPTFARDLIRAIADSAPVASRDAGLLVWDPDRYPYTDLGSARFLRDYIVSTGSGVRYTPEAGYLLLEDGVWTVDTRQSVRTHAQAVADLAARLAADARRAAAGVDATDALRKRAGRMTSHANYLQSTRGLDSMIREMQAVEGVPAAFEEFDRDPDILAVRNGVVNLRTGQLRDPLPSDMVSRRVDVDYYPDARAPRWEQFLRECHPEDPLMPDYLRRLAGYGITGRTDEQVFVIHLGRGANGKSIFLDALATTFAAVATITPFSTFEAKPSGGIPNDIAALKGSRLVMASEGERGKFMAEALIKRITGRDLITARFMRKEFFTFRPSFLLQLATNFEPNFRGQDPGLWRRVRLVKWAVDFRKTGTIDSRLHMKLEAEREGILAWAIRGAVEWYRTGLEDPPTVTENIRNFRATTDVLEGFLPGVYVHDPEARAVPGKTIFRDFQSWAVDENQRDLMGWSQRALYSALAERGIVKRKSSTVVFDGLRKATPVTAAAAGDPAPTSPIRTGGARLEDVL